MPYPDYTDEEMLELLSQGDTARPGVPQVTQLGPQVTQLGGPRVEVGPITQPMRPRPEIGEARLLEQPDPELVPAPKQPPPTSRAPERPLNFVDDETALTSLADLPHSMQRNPYDPPVPKGPPLPPETPGQWARGNPGLTPASVQALLEYEAITGRGQGARDRGVGPLNPSGAAPKDEGPLGRRAVPAFTPKLPAWTDEQEALDSLISERDPQAAPQQQGQAFRTRQATPPQEMAARMEAPPAAPGQRPQLYGHNDNVEFDWRSNANAAAQAAMRAGAQQQQPRQRPDDQQALAALISDADIQRAWRANTLYGQRGDNTAVANMQLRQRQEQIEQGQRQRALEQSYGGRGGNVDPGTAALLGAAGLSPEAAASVPRNAPWLASLPNLATMGVNDKKNDLQHQRTYLNELGKDYRQEVGEEGKDRRAQLGADTQREVARTHAAARRDSQGGELDPVAFMSSVVTDNLRIPKQRADDIARGGDISDLPEDAQRQIEAWRYQLPQLAKNPARASSFISTSLNREGAIPDKNAAAASDPRTLWKQDEALASIAEPFMQAGQSLMRLRDSGALSKLSKFGTGGWASAIKNAGLTSEEQADAGAMYNFLSDFAHGRYGASFTVPEQAQLSAGTGVKFGSGVDPTGDPAVVLRFFSNMKRVLKGREERMKKYFPGTR